MEKVSKEEMHRIRTDNQHKKVVSTLEELLTIINQPKTNDKIDAVILKHSEAIESFVQLLTELKKPVPAPIVTVETNQDKVVSSLHELGEKILMELSEIKSMRRPPDSWKHEVERDNLERTKTVISTPQYK